MPDHACGPSHHREFFAAVAGLRDVAGIGRYMITCIDHETQVLGINFETHVGLSAVTADGSLETSFVSLAQVDGEPGLSPYKWLQGKPIAFLSLDQPVQRDFRGPSIDQEYFRRIKQIGAALPYAIASRDVFATAVSYKRDLHMIQSKLNAAGVTQTIVRRLGTLGDKVCCSWDDDTGNCNGTWEDA